MNKAIELAAFFVLIGSLTSKVIAAPLEVPFDFSRSEISIEVFINGKSIHAILDTGVDPSVIDITAAQALGLKVDRSVSGEAGGFGDDRGATVFPAKIEGLTISGRRFPVFDALASDTSQFTSHDQHGSTLSLATAFCPTKSSSSITLPTS